MVAITAWWMGLSLDPKLLKRCQVVGIGCEHPHFKSQILLGIKAWTSTGPLQNIHLIDFKSLCKLVHNVMQLLMAFIPL